MVSQVVQWLGFCQGKERLLDYSQLRNVIGVGITEWWPRQLFLAQPTGATQGTTPGSTNPVYPPPFSVSSKGIGESI